MKRPFLCLIPVLVGVVILAVPAAADPYYVFTTPSAAGWTFGDHLVGQSVPGQGGTAILSNDADTLNGLRTTMWDVGAEPSLLSGFIQAADPDFAMLIWDMGKPVDTIRVYPHQEHYTGLSFFHGEQDPFDAAELLAESVWGSNDLENWVLLSDVTGVAYWDALGYPHYSFAPMAPVSIYPLGSLEIPPTLCPLTDHCGSELVIINGFTREYVFDTAYRYYGIRAATIALLEHHDDEDVFHLADPEIDAIATPIPEPSSMFILGIGLVGTLAGLWSKARRRS